MENTTNSHGRKQTRRAGLKSRGAMADSIDECVKLSINSTLLGNGRQHSESEHIGLLSACASICETSAKFMIMGSEFHRDTCGICAEIYAKCADICWRCSDSCEQMSIKPVF